MKRIQTNTIARDDLPFLSIWDSVKAKNPKWDKCWCVDEFIKEFTTIAQRNEHFVKPHLVGNKKNKTEINALKLKADIWRPNAVYGNRPNGTKEDRVIMGTGLYSFDIDFDDFWNFKEHQERLEGYKETLMRDCPNIFAVYKSFSMTGLHVITMGMSVLNAGSYRHMWEYERRKLKRDFRFVKIDEKAKDITRALFIGSDANPLFQDKKTRSMSVWMDEKEYASLLKEKVIELPTLRDLAFAKVQCFIKPTFLKDTQRRYIRFFTTYNDLEDVIKERFSKVFKHNIKVASGEDYVVEAYLIDTIDPIYLPRFYIADGFIPVGRRRSTLVSLLSKFIYLNGYWVTDHVALVKKHFDRHYFEKFEQRKGQPFTKEEMFSVIDSVMKERLIPEEINHKSDDKQNFYAKRVFIDHDKNKLSQYQSGAVVMRYNLLRKIETVKTIVCFLYKAHGELNQKELYYKGENIFNLVGVSTLSSFRQFVYRYKIDLTYLHIIKTYSTSTNKYVEVLDTN